jgi:hypothetical protein
VGRLDAQPLENQVFLKLSFFAAEKFLLFKKLSDRIPIHAKN